MSDDMELRPMDINAEVEIRLPAYVLWGFLSAYNSTRWANSEANAIALAITKAMVHPRILNEMLAKQRDREEVQKKMEDKMRRLAFLPDFPGMPGTEGPDE